MAINHIMVGTSNITERILNIVSPLRYAEISTNN